MNAPTPAVLWHQAEQEYPWPNDPEKVRTRYWELMREHGHVVKREPGDDSPLFACGYDTRAAPSSYEVGPQTGETTT